ncbi:MAG: biotin carboxylase [Planctomycetota bacterium]|jgi:biotin carboxylase
MRDEVQPEEARTTRAALISVAAGASQLPLLRSAKELGLAIVALDQDPDAAGFALCDLAVIASSHDSEEAQGALSKALATRPDLRPVCVVTKSSGAPVATAADLARALTLPGLCPKRARSLVAKPGQLKFALMAGVRVPRHCAPPSLGELENTGLKPPLVLKPAATRVGKQAVTLVTQSSEQSSEMQARFEEACAASADGRCEVEEYLPGDDLVIATLFRDSRVVSMVELDEDTRFLPSGEVCGFGLSMPSQFCGSEALEETRSAVERFVGQLELGTGFGLWTFRVTPSGPPAMLEVHLDLAGDLVTDLLMPRALGVDPISLALGNLLGEPVSFPGVRQPAALRFLFEGDRQSLEAVNFGKDACLGELTLYPSVAPGGRIGHVVLERDDVAQLSAAIVSLDTALGRVS